MPLVLTDTGSALIERVRVRFGDARVLGSRAAAARGVWSGAA